jgi:glycosyltransferase involved in cell wall biosynthesis
VHEGGYTVDRDGRFYDPWGQPFPAVPSLPRGHPDRLRERNRGLPIDADTCQPGMGDPVELADAVDALLVDETLRARASRAAVEGFRRDFRRERCHAAFRELYLSYLR